MIKPLQLALLISVGVAAVASAQPAPSPATGFSGITGKRSITVVDDAGRRTRGSVVRFTADQLTLNVDGRDFTALAARRSVTVADDSGAEIEGSLVRLTAEEVTLRVDGQDRAFARERVAAIFERGDSVKNGATIGFLSGAVLGAFAAERNSCGGVPGRNQRRDDFDRAVAGASRVGLLTSVSW